MTARMLITIFYILFGPAAIMLVAMLTRDEMLVIYFTMLVGTMAVFDVARVRLPGPFQRILDGGGQ